MSALGIGPHVKHLLALVGPAEFWRYAAETDGAVLETRTDIAEWVDPFERVTVAHWTAHRYGVDLACEACSCRRRHPASWDALADVDYPDALALVRPAWLPVRLVQPALFRTEGYESSEAVA